MEVKKVLVKVSVLVSSTMGNKVDCGRQREDEWDFYGLGQVEQVSPRPHATSYVTLTGPHFTLCFDLSYLIWCFIISVTAWYWSTITSFAHMFGS